MIGEKYNIKVSIHKDKIMKLMRNRPHLVSSGYQSNRMEIIYLWMAWRNVKSAGGRCKLSSY